MFDLTLINVWQAYQQLNPYFWWCCLVIPVVFFAVMHGLSGNAGALLVLGTALALITWGWSVDHARLSPMIHFHHPKVLVVIGWSLIMAGVAMAHAFGSALYRRRLRQTLER